MKRFRRWRQNRRRFERCETCGRWLRRTEAVEITSTFEVGERDPWGGSSYGTISAVYCKVHAPKGMAQVFEFRDRIEP